MPEITSIKPPVLKVGITGQSGFLGSHLAQAVSQSPGLALVTDSIRDFADTDALRHFVSSSDVILHFAGASRMPCEEELYKTNTGLVTKLIDAMDATCSRPHVFFASSTHETRNTAYGRSKREGRTRLANWAKKNNIPFTGLVIPNVFGPGARVHYCSFIANFAWELQHGVEPAIQVDASIKLLYVENLEKLILNRIQNPTFSELYPITPDFEMRVSDVLKLFKDFTQAAPPKTADSNVLNLYKTFVSYK